jgi:hypothetical protein
MKIATCLARKFILVLEISSRKDKMAVSPYRLGSNGYRYQGFKGFRASNCLLEEE